MSPAVLDALEATKTYLEHWLAQHQGRRWAVRYARGKLYLTAWLIETLHRSPALAGDPALTDRAADLAALLDAAALAADDARLREVLPVGSDHADVVRLRETVEFSWTKVVQLYEQHVTWMGRQAAPAAQDYAYEQTVGYRLLEVTLIRFGVIRYAQIKELWDRRAQTRMACPCCWQVRSPGEITILYDTFAHSRRGQTLTREMLEQHVTALATYAHDGWACDICFARGRAVRANPDAQELKGSYGHPYYAYYDRPVHCQDCGARFVFAVSEQQYWYETLKFFIASRPVRCPACRRDERDQKRHARDLEAALKTLDAGQPDQLAHVAELYLLAGNRPKAVEFLRRAKNKARTQDEKDNVLQRIQAIQDAAADSPGAVS